MTAPTRSPEFFDPVALAQAVRERAPVTDAWFERLYPPPLRIMSGTHWTPLAIAQRVVALLDPTGDEVMLDVGAGVGKVVLVGALQSSARWWGLELRAPLVRAATQAARALEVADRVSMFEDDARSFDWSMADGVYLFNPFGELQMRADASTLRPVGPLAGLVAMTERRAARDELIQIACERAWTLRPGSRVVTYHGFGGSWPRCLDLVAREPAGADVLELWVRVGDPRSSPPPASSSSSVVVVVVEA
jgi:predicted RNA methylase